MRVTFLGVVLLIFFSMGCTQVPEGPGITQGEPDEYEVTEDVQAFFDECTAKGGVIGGTGGVKAGLPTTEEGYTCWYENRDCWDFLTYSRERYMGGNPGCPEAGATAPTPTTSAPDPIIGSKWTGKLTNEDAWNYGSENKGSDLIGAVGEFSFTVAEDGDISGSGTGEVHMKEVTYCIGETSFGNIPLKIDGTYDSEYESQFEIKVKFNIPEDQHFDSVCTDYEGNPIVSESNMRSTMIWFTSKLKSEDGALDEGIISTSSQPVGGPPSSSHGTITIKRVG